MLKSAAARVAAARVAAARVAAARVTAARVARTRQPLGGATPLLLAIALLLTFLPAVAGAASFEVDIADDGFKPPTLTVRVGDSVTWTNKAGRAHTVTSDAGTELDSGDIGAGEAYGHLFEAPGSYPYHSLTQPDRLRGTITVLAALPTTPGGTPEATPPAGTLPPNFSPFPSLGPPPTEESSLAPTPAATPAATPGTGAGAGDTGLLLLIVAAIALGATGVVLARRRH